MPDGIITHAPQAPYFKDDYYMHRGYVAVHEAVGDLINFYNIQFYNQGDTRYDTYDELFVKATGKFSGTALIEIANKGVDANKLVLGKPVNTGDASNTGFIECNTLANYISQAYK